MRHPKTKDRRCAGLNDGSDTMLRRSQDFFTGVCALVFSPEGGGVFDIFPGREEGKTLATLMGRVIK